MTEVNITSILERFDKKNQFFLEKGERLALGMDLNFDASVQKWLKLNVRMFWRLIPPFVKNTEEKLVRWAFWPSSPS